MEDVIPPISDSSLLALPATLRWSWREIRLLIKTFANAAENGERLYTACCMSPLMCCLPFSTAALCSNPTRCDNMSKKRKEKNGGYSGAFALAHHQRVRSRIFEAVSLWIGDIDLALFGLLPEMDDSPEFT